MIFERAKFNQRIQRENKPVDAFITDLHKLAQNCSYGALHDEMIRDRIVVGLRDKALSEKLQFGIRFNTGESSESSQTKGASTSTTRGIKASGATGYRVYRQVKIEEFYRQEIIYSTIQLTRPKVNPTNTNCGHCGGKLHRRNEFPAKDSIAMPVKTGGIEKRCADLPRR